MSTSCERWETTSGSEEETLGLGARLGEILRAGDVVALEGELGAGKTYFVKGIAAGLGVRDVREVRSPTFVLVSEYAGKVRMYHVDAYRLKGAEDLEALGGREFVFGEGVTVVEWADRVKEMMPGETVWVTIHHAGEGKRNLLFEGRDRGAEIVRRLRKP